MRVDWLHLIDTPSRVTWASLHMTYILTGPGAEDGAEDLGHGRVVKLGEGHVVEVAHEAWRHRVPAATRGPHGAHVVHVHQAPEVTCTGSRSE